MKVRERGGGVCGASCGGDPVAGQVTRGLLSQRKGGCFPRGQLKKRRLNAGVHQLVSGQEKPEDERLFPMASVSLFTVVPGQAVSLLCLFQLGPKNTAILWIKPGGGHGNPLQYPCLESPHGQRSLASYGLQGRKESDTTE